MRKRGPRLFTASHLLQNVREQNVLARFVRLPRDGAPLGVESFSEPVLAQSHRGDEVECVRLMDIEPAGVTQRRLGARRVAFLRV